MIPFRFLDLDWILENLPVKSLGSNMSNDREAIRSSTIPSWPWFWFSTSRSRPWLSAGPSQGAEALLSAPRLLVHVTSSWDMSPLSLPPSWKSVVNNWLSSALARRHYMMVQQEAWQKQQSLVRQRDQGILQPPCSFSSPSCPHLGIQFLLTRISSLYVKFIQSTDSELTALLDTQALLRVQVHLSPSVPFE